MEQDTLRKIEFELSALKKMVQDISGYLIDDEAGFEVSDEVVREVEESRKMDGKDLVSHEEVFKRFCK